MEDTVSPGHVRTSLISVFIAFLGRSRQADVVCITIHLKLLIVNIETNRKSSTGSNVDLVPWGHDEPGSDADDVPCFYKPKKVSVFVTRFCIARH